MKHSFEEPLDAMRSIIANRLTKETIVQSSKKYCITKHKTIEGSCPRYFYNLYRYDKERETLKLCNRYIDFECAYGDMERGFYD